MQRACYERDAHSAHSRADFIRRFGYINRKFYAERTAENRHILRERIVSQTRIFVCGKGNEKGRQAYIVCPLIDESENLDVMSGEKMFAHLANEVFPTRKIGLLHGKMKADEKDKVMQSFKNGELDILVSTTVIEVGVDVPNATIMLIENAERFGLSQLHQLRGRVGRGEHKSYCILFCNALDNEKTAERMKIMVKSSDGFEIAKKTLNCADSVNFSERASTACRHLKLQIFSPIWKF